MEKISAQFSIHDNYQLEIKSIYPLDCDEKRSGYAMDMYFFFPRNLGMNSQSISSADFYADLQEYIRFKTPAVPLQELSDPGNRFFSRLQASVEPLPRALKNFEKNLKMYCSIIRSSLRDGAGILKNAHSRGKNCSKRAAAYIADCEKTLELLRGLRKKLPAKGHSAELFDLVDEYLSITVNGYLCDLYQAIPEEELSKKIAQATAREIKYRKNRNYPSVPEPGADNSELLYRESTLKKAMASVLFLKVLTRRDGVMLENFFMGLAAAVAMIFVTAIAFLWQGMELGQFSASFFMVWVIAYMFKDRIKSLLQGYFLSRRNLYTYDYRQKICDGLGNTVGIFREGVRFCNAKDVEKEIFAIRGRTLLSRLENGADEENVLIYRKKVDLSGTACSEMFQQFSINGIVNIQRLNVRRFLSKMDNPKRMVYYSDGKNLIPVKAHRDYHVNIVLRIRRSGRKDQFRRLRLTLCRNGIRRVEEL